MNEYYLTRKKNECNKNVKHETGNEVVFDIVSLVFIKKKI